jgi:hypothetical protein
VADSDNNNLSENNLVAIKPRGNPDIWKYGFKKGQSGNPHGRPKRKPLTEVLLRALGNPEQCEAIVAMWLKQAQKGSINHLREMLDRVEGRVPQPLSVSGHVTHEMTDEEKARAREILARMTAYDAQPLPPASVDAASEEDENARD